MAAEKFLKEVNGISKRTAAIQVGGAGKEDKIPALDGTGKFDLSMMPNIFAPNFKQVSSPSSDSVTGTDPAIIIEKLKLTTDTITSGIYCMMTYFEWTSDNDKKAWEGRIRLNDTTDLLNWNMSPRKTIPDGRWYSQSGFSFPTLIAGVHFFDLDYWAELNTTAHIRNAKIAFWRVW